MEKFEIEGGNQLNGTVKIKGAKNSVLPLLCASVLTDEDVTIYDCPKILDVANMVKILKNLGVKVSCQGDSITTYGQITNDCIPFTLAKEMRSSVFMLGTMLSILGTAETYLPGGCDIGKRPIDLHISGLEQMGVKFEEDGSKLKCKTKGLHGADVILKKSSVGATENLILAGVLAEGKTVIENAALEPEIVDLCEMLKNMGAKITGEGTSIIEIVGVEKLSGVRYTPIPDRIVAGTILTAVAMTGGVVDIVNANEDHLTEIVKRLTNSSCKINSRYGITHIESYGAPSCIRELETAAYPGFPTDMQAQFMSMLSIADGSSIISERIFENRFGIVPELQKMGADIRLVHNIASITGVRHLVGSEVNATDLRGGSALVLAGLVATGKTVLHGINHIDRGYENLEKIFQSLGGSIVRKTK